MFLYLHIIPLFTDTNSTSDDKNIYKAQQSGHALTVAMIKVDDKMEEII